MIVAMRIVLIGVIYGSPIVLYRDTSSASFRESYRPRCCAMSGIITNLKMRCRSAHSPIEGKSRRRLLGKRIPFSFLIRRREDAEMEMTMGEGVGNLAVFAKTARETRGRRRWIWDNLGKNTAMLRAPKFPFANSGRKWVTKTSLH